MTTDPIYLNRQGEIAELVLNRPDKHNALNREIWCAIPGLVREVETDPALKVLIVRGVGAKAFAAGADIAEFPKVHATLESAMAYHGEIAAAFEAMHQMAKPTIAMISGICFGGGCALALTCDLRYADETARFCIPPAKLGIAYSLRESKRLTDVVGPSRAKEILMGAKIIEAREAEQIGLVTRLFQSENLEAETRAFAENLCGLSQYTIRAVKQTVNAIVEGETQDNSMTRELQKNAFSSPDYREGRDAFLQKRTAKFTYR